MELQHPRFAQGKIARYSAQRVIFSAANIAAIVCKGR